MSLHKINKHEIYDDLVDTEQTLSRKVITKMISSINKYNTGKYDGLYLPRLFINDCFIDDLFVQTYVLSPIRDLNKSNDENGHTLTVIGKISGVDVYVSDVLEEHEYFVGQSESQISKLKRNKKISKILERC